ncbi:hypothetical protein [Asaia bogorensis]|uniref:hypothetical protein n=1 Tax=Asaia bogorensis TaxID=91915 RepID=UPI000EFC6A29|nr:hypothetical protein [Asaia bogorensis]
MRKLDIPNAPPGPGMGQELVRLGTDMLALKGTITAAEMRALAKYLTQAGARHQSVVNAANILSAKDRLNRTFRPHEVTRDGLTLIPVIGVVS